MPTINVNNININFETSGEGEPLVLLHGLQSDIDIFDSIRHKLSNLYNVIVFDQRGSGKTDKPDCEYSMSLLASDTKEFLQQLKIEKVNIFGISMGGMVAQAIAIDFPEIVKTLILGCTIPGDFAHMVPVNENPNKDIAFSPDETIPPEVRAKALADIIYAPGFIEKHPDILQKLIADRKKTPISGVGLQHRIEAIENSDMFNQLSNIKNKTMVITGKNDQSVHWQNSKILHEQIKGSVFELLEPAGHVFWDEHPDKTVQIISEFIKHSNN